MSSTHNVRGMLEGVARGYSSPHPCGPCDLGVTSAPCNCLPEGESVRRLEAALLAVLDLHEELEQPPQTSICGGCDNTWPCGTVEAISDALARVIPSDPRQDQDAEEEAEETGAVWVGGCTCNAVFMGPGNGHESYCGWENP